MTSVVTRPLVDDQTADPMLRALLAEAHGASTVSDADLARFTARFAPLVGLPLMASGVPGSAAAPASPAGLEVAGKAVLATGKAAAGKLLGVSVLKITAASLAVGASLWFARGAVQTTALPVAARIEAPALPAVLPEPAVQAPEPREQPSVSVAPSTADVPSVPKRRDRAVRANGRAAAVPDELSLIHEAQALRSQPSRALALLGQHRQLYPTGLLSQEREVLVVEALLASGKRADAEARAAAFMRAYPGSVHSARLRSMLQQPLAD